MQKSELSCRAYLEPASNSPSGIQRRLSQTRGAQSTDRLSPRAHYQLSLCRIIAHMVKRRFAEHPSPCSFLFFDLYLFNYICLCWVFLHVFSFYFCLQAARCFSTAERNQTALRDISRPGQRDEMSFQSRKKDERTSIYVSGITALCYGALEHAIHVQVHIHTAIWIVRPTFPSYDGGTMGIQVPVHTSYFPLKSRLVG